MTAAYADGGGGELMLVTAWCIHTTARERSSADDVGGSSGRCTTTSRSSSLTRRCGSWFPARARPRSDCGRSLDAAASDGSSRCWRACPTQRTAAGRNGRSAIARSSKGEMSSILRPSFATSRCGPPERSCRRASVSSTSGPVRCLRRSCVTHSVSMLSALARTSTRASPRRLRRDHWSASRRHVRILRRQSSDEPTGRDPGRVGPGRVRARLRDGPRARGAGRRDGVRQRASELDDIACAYDARFAEALPSAPGRPSTVRSTRQIAWAPHACGVTAAPVARTANGDTPRPMTEPAEIR
jgi:hypothetical protein